MGVVHFGTFNSQIFLDLFVVMNTIALDPNAANGSLFLYAKDDRFALGAVVGLDDLETLVPVVQQLGARHRKYGVQVAHYGTVAEALQQLDCPVAAELLRNAI